MRALARLAVALSAALLGCTSDSGSTAAPITCGEGTMRKGSECVPSYASGFAGAGGAGGSDTTSLGCTDTQGACHQCISKSCGSACTACQGAPDCVAKIECVTACNNDTCKAGCADLYPLGASVFESFDACLANSCAKACAPGAGGAAGSGGGASGGLDCSASSLDPCDQCGTKNCASSCQACAAVPDCSAQVACLGTCSDKACAAMCASQYAAGSKALGAFAMCLQKSCATACGSGSAGAGGGN